MARKSGARTAPAVTSDSKSNDAFESAFSTVKALAASFISNKHHYVDSGLYQEMETRTDFIDKFFVALGWDVNHDRERDPYRQEVKIEKTTDKHSAGRAD